jgi:hypothetical protein
MTNQARRAVMSPDGSQYMMVVVGSVAFIIVVASPQTSYSGDNSYYNKRLIFHLRAAIPFPE